MSTSHQAQCSGFLRSSVILFALMVVLIPQTVCAEPMLFLFKNGVNKTTEQPDAVHQNARQMVIGLNKNGDLMVKCGSVNVVLAYSSAVDPLKQPEPVRRAAAMNMDQGAPPISGMSISLNFAF